MAGYRRCVKIAIVLVVSSALIWGGLASGQTRTSVATTTVKVTILDNKITLSKKSAALGKVTFLIQNHGKLVHNFRIAGKTSKAVAKSKTTKLVVVFKAAKSYAYLSTLPHGKTKGLNGVFKAIKPAPTVPGNAKAGAAVFSTAGCRSCHTLKAASASGTIGPNLDKVKPSYALTVTRVTNGKGAMPPFKSTLTVTQIQNVAAFVYASTH
jgi:mono/diheme cytochrome c family protein